MNELKSSDSVVSSKWLSPLAVGLYFAALKLLLHFSVNSNYGYFRDELYFLACAEHLDWGYPDHAPLVALMAKLSRTLLGDSLFAIRFIPAVAGAFKLFLTAVLVRQFGGKTWAALLACLGVFFAPMYLAIDNLFSMNSLEPIFWMLCVYFAMRGVSENPAPPQDSANASAPGNPSKNWLFFGIFAGLGLMNKHSMAFFGAALVTGILLTNKRRVLLDKYFWFGGIIALLIFLPNIVWQFQNDFATLELLQNVQKTGKNVVMSPFGFFVSQIMGLSPAALPVWLAGIWFLLFDKHGRRWRFLGICYLVLLAIMIFLKAKDYYLVPIYPMLFAAGGVWWERMIEQIRALIIARYALPILIIALGVFAAPAVIPVLPVETLIRYQEATGLKPPKAEVAHDSPLQQIFADQFGWREMVEKTAEVYRNLPPEERERAAILTSNYGQAGAVDLFGGQFGLPKSISRHQSYYLWGARDYSGDVLIMLGWKKADAEKMCESVEEKTEVNHPFSPSYEKYNILVCRRTKEPLATLWEKIKLWN